MITKHYDDSRKFTEIFKVTNIENIFLNMIGWTMEIIVFIILGLLWLGMITPYPPDKNDKPVKYWNNGR